MSQNQNSDNVTFKGWEPQTEEVDFFGTTTEVTTLVPENQSSTEEVSEKDTTEESATTTNETSDTTTPSEEDTFFGETVNDDTEEGTTKAVKTDTTEENNGEGGSEEEPEMLSGALGTLAYLKDNGRVEYELEDDEELTEEKAAQILEDNYEASVEDRVGELFEDLPPELKALNKFVIDGGDFRQFLGTLAKGGPAQINSALDLEQEANQELVIRTSLEAEEYDKDYIDTQIEFLKDSKKLASTAKAKFNKMEKAREKQVQALAEQQAAAKRARKEALRKSKTELSGSLKDMEDVNGLPLSKKEKKELPAYMVDRNVPLQNGGSITTMQKDLMEALKDEKKALFIAKLLKSDFDLSALEKKATTKVTKKVKDNLRRNKNNAKNVRSTDSGATSPAKKSLFDYF